MKLTRFRRRSVVFLHDVLMIIIAWLGAYWLRFNLGEIPSTTIKEAEVLLPVVFVIQAACFYAFGLYRGVWRYASMADLARIIKAVLVGASLIVMSVFVYDRLQGVPRSVFPLYALILTSALGASRFFYRLFKERQQFHDNAKRILVVGAGSAGEGLVRDLFRDTTPQCQPVVFVDDADRKQGMDVHGVPVLGKVADIPRLVEAHAIDLIFIALPSANSAQMRTVLNACEKTPATLRTLPSLADLTEGRVNVNALREVKLEDLLGRDQVESDWQQLFSCVMGQVAIVTGGGGSIGSELCRQLAKLGVARLIIVENSEFNLYRIEKELMEDFPELDISIHLGSVTDATAINRLFVAVEPQFIFHAAAYKHVPLLENQLRTAITNNVLGTQVVAEAAARVNAERFVLISTDKAVNPTNIMGASKRAAEIFCQNLDAHTKTQFITVRFGNVLGSAGSVVPLFRQQIERGGPVTVTHPDITRYFMTIPEACQLILQAMLQGQGGEIYVLDMGEPVKIRYLAEQMIRLCGKKIDEDIEIIYTGLRPGEKLYEELFHQREQLKQTEHSKIYKAKHRQIDWNSLLDILQDMQHACDLHHDEILASLLKSLVSEYHVQHVQKDLEHAVCQ